MPSNVVFFAFFFHPDFTVGFGVSPDRPCRAFICPSWFADFTASRESHPTLKNFPFSFTTLLYHAGYLMSSKNMEKSINGNLFPFAAS